MHMDPRAGEHFGLRSWSSVHPWSQKARVFEALLMFSSRQWTAHRKTVTPIANAMFGPGFWSEKGICGDACGCWSVGLGRGLVVLYVSYLSSLFFSCLLLLMFFMFAVPFHPSVFTSRNISTRSLLRHWHPHAFRLHESAIHLYTYWLHVLHLPQILTFVCIVAIVYGCKFFTKKKDSKLRVCLLREHTSIPRE
jgi:hypothetical protein